MYDMQPKLPTIADFLEFLNRKMCCEYFHKPPPEIPASSHPKSGYESHSNSKKPAWKKKGSVFVACASPPIRPANSCPACKSPHDLPSCESFGELTVGDRINLVRSERFCLCCLRPGNGIKLCRSQSECGFADCSAKHHTKLHGAPPLIPKSNANKQTSSSLSVANSASAFSGHCGLPSSVLLSVVPVRVSANGKFVNTKALLDSGSQLTLIREDVARELDLRGQTQDIRFGTFHGFDPIIVTRKVKFLVSARDSKFSVLVNEAYTVDNLNIFVGEADQKALQLCWDHISNLE